MVHKNVLLHKKNKMLIHKVYKRVEKVFTKYYLGRMMMGGFVFKLRHFSYLFKINF